MFQAYTYDELWLYTVNASVVKAREALEGLEKMGVAAEAALSAADHKHFVRRWNMVTFKARKIAMLVEKTI